MTLTLISSTNKTMVL